MTLTLLKKEAKQFALKITAEVIADLFGVTDGKKIGTFLEHQFRQYLDQHYSFTEGSSSQGIDFPDLGVDLKTTSVTQPQSSCPFKEAAQKVYGLGYGLLVMVYDKQDDHQSSSALLMIRHVIYIDQAHTGDYQTTLGLRRILEQDGNLDDITAFLEERHLPLDEIGRTQRARRIIENPPQIGVLTISNALQWRLQYSRAIDTASHNSRQGVEKLLD